MKEIKLNINKHAQVDEHGNTLWVGKDDCGYESPQSFVQIGMFDFCGCGDNKTNLLYILAGLKQLRQLKEEVWEDKLTHEEWEGHNIAIFGSEEATQFFWYWLDANTLSEHGSCIPGWLTVQGEELLSDLEFITSEYDELEKKFHNFGTAECRDGAKILQPTQPPLGIRPLWIVKELRLTEIKAGIKRYRKARKEIPAEWLEEKADIETYLKAQQKPQ